MDATTRDRTLAILGIATRGVEDQPRNPHTGEWIDTGLIKRIVNDVKATIKGATTSVDWRGVHITAPVRDQSVTVTVTPLDLAAVALLAVPGAGEVGAAVEVARAALVVKRIRQALAVAKAAETVAHSVSANRRDRELRLLGNETRAYDPKLHPHAPAGGPNGGEFISTHGLLNAVDEILTDAEAARDYGDELDRVDFANDTCVVARSEGVLTIQSGYDDGRALIHAAPSPTEAQEWADAIESLLGQTGGKPGPSGMVEVEHADGMLAGRDAVGGISVRWADTEFDDADGLDLSPDEAADLVAALRDMAYITEDHGNLPEGTEGEEPEGDETPIPDTYARDRHLRLLGIETRKYNPAQKRVSKGFTTGGQFLSLSARVLSDLKTWINAGGTDPDPLKAYSQPQLKSAATQLGLNPPMGMKLVPLKALLMAHFSPQQAQPAPQSASTTVSSAVSGIKGVTATQVPVQVVPGPAWMSPPSQSIKLRLGGADLGTIHRHSWGWVADSPAGNRLHAGGKNTKTAAVKALVAHHQARTLAQTGVPGVTLRPAPTLSSAPGAASLDVEHNGTIVGSMHTNPSGQWTAFPPSGASWGLQANPGSGQTYNTKDEAVKALVDAHAAHAAQAVPSSLFWLGSSPRVTFSKSARGYNVHASGIVVGAVRQGPTGWWVAVQPGRSWSGVTVNPGPHRTRKSAADVLVSALTGHLGPPPQQSQPQLKQIGPDAVAVWLNGTRAGSVQKDVSDQSWYAYPSASFRIAQYRTGPHSSEQQALDDLLKLASSVATFLPPDVRHAGGNDFDIDVNGSSVTATVTYRSGNWYTFAPGLGPAGPFPTQLKALEHLVAQAPQLAPARPDPAIRAAREVLYGVDPKAKTATRQLQAYGDLKKSHFDTLTLAEQTTLLGDLSYIASTSKGPNKDRAEKLIDRFTPAGTPQGTIPTQPALPPPGSISNQTRVVDPAGTPGLLSILPSAKRGRGGDGWVSAGSRRVWGQYGAAGLLLRHVDATGEERFLMIERGPGISDPGKWQFPGGAKDEKETFHQGASREVVEELGFAPSDLDQARVHGTHTAEAQGVMVPGLHGAQVPWAYVSIAATVPDQLVPDLSSHHARLETSDAKWMTRAEIADLDRKGKLLSPLAGGQLETNVMTLFPTRASSAGRPAPRTTRPPRLKAPKPAHKPSRGRNLVSDAAAQDSLRQQIKATRRSYRGKTADERLAAIGAIQGYDDTPTVVSRAEMDRLLATGDYIEAWRGVPGGNGKSAAQIHEEMRSGPAYYGTGIFGNGYYLATQRSVALNYSDGSKNSVIRILIPKSAKTDPFEAVHRRAKATRSSNATTYSGQRQGDTGGVGTLRDPGRFAAAEGLDGIEIGPGISLPSIGGSGHIASAGKPAYNWVNRSVLIIQEADP